MKYEISVGKFSVKGSVNFSCILSEIFRLFPCSTCGVARNFFGREGVQYIQLRAQGREKGDMGAVAHSHGLRSIFK
jgi:hypothetical protein